MCRLESSRTSKRLWRGVNSLFREQEPTAVRQGGRHFPQVARGDRAVAMDFITSQENMFAALKKLYADGADKAPQEFMDLQEQIKV